MTHLRTRILRAELATAAARQEVVIWREHFHRAVGRTVSDPLTLGSGIAVGFLLGRYRRPRHLPQPIVARLQRIMHMSGMLGGWSLGYDVFTTLLQSRRRKPEVAAGKQ